MKSRTTPKDKNTPVLLCEGEPDTICARSHGLNAITKTGKKKLTKDQLSFFEGRDVVIAYDADKPGQKYAQQDAREISKVAKSVRIIEWPDFMGRLDDGSWPDNHGQDLTDFLCMPGKTAIDFQNLMDDAPLFTAPEPEIKSRAKIFFKRGVNGRLSLKTRRLAEYIRKKYTLSFDPATGILYQYNGRYYEEFHEDHLRAFAIQLLGDEAKQAWVQDAIFQIKALSTIPHGRALNDNSDYLCVKNGMLNNDPLTPLTLEPHAPDFYASYELGVTYTPESKKECSAWLTFLSETIQTPGPIDQVQEFFGYCLLRKTPFAKCLLLLGPGSDGKSTLLHVLRDIIGPENCAAVALSELEDQFQRSAIYQKMVNISTEVGSKAIESPYFKAITSGDPVNAAFKHKNTFPFLPYCKLIFAANKMPRVRDNSDGFFRRILPISFKRQYLEGDPATDPFLKDKLLAEKTEIFHWALAGLRRLMKNGKFTSSSETDELLMEYKRLNGPVVCFIQDVCEIDANDQAPKKELYSAYESYCRNNGYHKYSRENFFRELYSGYSSLKTYRPRAGNTRREYYVKGLRIRGVMS